MFSEDNLEHDNYEFTDANIEDSIGNPRKFNTQYDQLCLQFVMGIDDYVFGY
jgi:hypothetical protein